MPFQSKLQTEEHTASTYSLLCDLVYEARDQVFVVPAGYITDFASIPASFRWLLERIGIHQKAAVVHDYLLTDRINHEDPAMAVSSRDADGIFRRILRELDVPFSTRWVMWAAVRLGALVSRRRARGRQFYKDLPAILLITVLIGWWVGPVSLVVLIGRLPVKLARRIG